MILTPFYASWSWKALNFEFGLYKLLHSTDKWNHYCKNAFWRKNFSKNNDRAKKEWQVDKTTVWHHNAIFISSINKKCSQHLLIFLSHFQQQIRLSFLHWINELEQDVKCLGRHRLTGMPLADWKRERKYSLTKLRFQSFISFQIWITLLFLPLRLPLNSEH